MFSVVFSHLSEILVKEGDVLDYQDPIGIMGTTGKSTGNHLHVSVVKGKRNVLWRLWQMNNGTVRPDKRETDYFALHHDLFIGQDGKKRKTIITTSWLSKDYKKEYGEDHPAYDLVDDGVGLPVIVWNRGVTSPIYGRVAKTGYDGAHGNYVIIHYDYEWVPEISFNPGDLVVIDIKATDQILRNNHLVIEGPDVPGLTWVRIGVNSDTLKKV